MYNFINYPKCSTCKNLKDILDKNNIKYNNRDIKLDNPSKLELNTWINKYNIDINKLFNTSGLVYKQLNLKDKIKTITIDEKLDLLASNGMLIKRPLLYNDNIFIIGNKIDIYNNLKEDPN